MGVVCYQNSWLFENGWSIDAFWYIISLNIKSLLKIDKIKFYYTTDLIQNSNTLERSLYDFVEENGKYRMRNVEAKILE